MDTKRRGRPPKNRLDYNVNAINPDESNPEHKFPISALEIPFTPKSPAHGLVYVVTTMSDKIKTIFEIYKDKIQTLAVMNFTNSGISFIYYEAEDTNAFIAKLFADKFSTYELIQPISINVGVELIFQIFKLLPKDYPIALSIDKEGEQYKLGISATNRSKKKNFNLDVTANAVIDPRCERFSTATYDFIVMMNSEDFQNEYKEIRSL